MGLRVWGVSMVMGGASGASRHAWRRELCGLGVVGVWLVGISMVIVEGLGPFCHARSGQLGGLGVKGVGGEGDFHGNDGDIWSLSVMFGEGNSMVLGGEGVWRGLHGDGEGCLGLLCYA